MNIYDLSRWDPTGYPWAPAALEQRRHTARLQNGLRAYAVLLAAAAGLGAVYFVTRRTVLLTALAALCCLLVPLWVLLVSAWLAARRRTAVLVRDDPAAAHDWDYSLYIQGKLRSAPLQNQSFLAMAVFGLRLGKWRQAAQALAGVNVQTLPHRDRPLWLYCRAVCRLAAGSEAAFAADMAAWQSMPRYGQFPSERAEQTAALQSRDVGRCCALLARRGSREGRRVFLTIWAALGSVWGLYGLLYVLLRALLPETLELRAWLATGSDTFLWAGGLVLLAAPVLYGIYRAAHRTDEILADLRLAGESLLLFALGLALMFVCWWVPGSGDDETLLPDGSLEVRVHYAWDSEVYASRAVGPFFRRRVTQTESGLSSDTAGDAAQSGAEAQNGGAVDTEAAVEQGYRAVLQAYYPNEADAAEFTVSAKGVPYVIVEETQTTRTRLVYDRISKNGACLLYVCYRDTMAADSQGGRYAEASPILNFYAYDPATGETAAADKTTWDGVSAEDYRAAAGE